MNTNFNNLTLLNNYLNSHIERMDQCEDKHAEINHLIQVVRQNEGLLKGENTPPDALAFLKSVTNLKEVDAENEELTQVTSAAMSVFTHLGINDINASLNAIHQLKEVGSAIYYQTLAGWIAEKMIDIGSLHLSNDEMIKLAPYLTYLSIQESEFSDEFIGELLENTKKLEYLMLVGCLTFNQPLPECLKSLTTLAMYHCPAFSQPLPDSMVSLTRLTIPDYPKEKKMEFLYSRYESDIVQAFALAGKIGIAISDLIKFVLTRKFSEQAEQISTWVTDVIFRFIPRNIPFLREDSVKKDPLLQLFLFQIYTHCDADDQENIDKFLTPFIKNPETLAPFTSKQGADALVKVFKKSKNLKKSQDRDSFLAYLNETKNLPVTLNYYQLLAGWIAEKKIILNSLGLSEYEVTKLAPHLTYLSLKDVNHKNFRNVGQLLQNAVNLTELVIDNCEMSEEALARMKHTEKLQVLRISAGGDFKVNYNLPADLRSLQTLVIGCIGFDRPLPKRMEHLQILIINSGSFNQPLPSVMPELRELSLDCHRFNHPLPERIGELRVLDIQCNQVPLSISGEWEGIEELKISACKGLTFDSSIKPLLEIYNARREKGLTLWVNAEDGDENILITEKDLKVYAHFVDKKPEDADAIIAMIKKMDPSYLGYLLERDDISFVKEVFLNDPLQQLNVYNLFKRIDSKKVPLLLGVLESLVRNSKDDFQTRCIEHLATMDKLESFLTYLESSKLVPTIRDKNSYYQSLIAWMTDFQIPIQSLNLTEEEMIELAPGLTYLDLSDVDFLSGKEGTFTDHFVGVLLEKTERLKYLKIAHSKIDGSALDRFKNTEQLESLVIEYCDNFNHSLPERLPHLRTLEINDTAFNQPLPEKLDAIRDFKIHSGRFNQPLPAWTGELESLDITSDDFNHPLPSKMANLQSLDLWDCDAFNQPLPKSMPFLRSLYISGKNFNQPFPEGLDKLKRLLRINCPALKIGTVMRFLLPIMQNDKARASVLAIGALSNKKNIDSGSELGIYEHFISQDPDQIDTISEWVQKIKAEELIRVMGKVEDPIPLGDPLQSIFFLGICAKVPTNKIPLIQHLFETTMKTPMDPPLQKFYERILSLKDPAEFLEFLTAANLIADALQDKTYYELLAIWIESEKLPLKSLGLSEEAMLELAPHLTYLDLKDLESAGDKHTFTNEFLGALLEKTEKLVTLKLHMSNINEEALLKFKNTQHLQNISIEGYGYGLDSNSVLKFLLPIYLVDRDRAVRLINSISKNYLFKESNESALLQLYFESQNPAQKDAISEWITKITPERLGKAISRKEIPFVREELLKADPLQQMMIYHICSGIATEHLPLVRQFLTPLIQSPMDEPLQKFYEIFASSEMSEAVLKRCVKMVADSHRDRERVLKFFSVLINEEGEKNLENLEKTGQLDLFLEKFPYAKEAVSIMGMDALFTEDGEENAKTIRLLSDLETEFNNLQGVVSIMEMPWSKEAESLSQTAAGKAFIKLHFHDIVKEPQLQEFVLRAFPPSNPENLALYPMEWELKDGAMRILEIHVIPTLPIFDAPRLLRIISGNQDVKKIKIYHYGSPGVDASGLGRQFVTEVMQGYVVNQGSLFTKTAGGEMYPYDPTHRLGANANRESYDALGKFLGMALRWGYPTGKVLSEKALNCMLGDDQGDEFDMDAILKMDPVAFIKFMREATIEAEESIKLYEGVFIDDESENVMKAARNLNDLLGDDEVDALIAGGADNIDQIRERLRTIWVEDQAYSFNALHAIGEGFWSRLPNKIGDHEISGWDDVRNMGAKELSKHLQGELTAQYVKEHIHVRIIQEETPEKRQTADDVRKWTDEWIDANGGDPEKLANFVEAFSGARAMTKDIYLDINPHYHTIEAHTCFYRADIPVGAKEGFLKLMWDDYATGNFRFDKI